MVSPPTATLEPHIGTRPETVTEWNQDVRP
jgi:hypothetical protein